MVMPRSRGAVSGMLLVLAGLWAGLVPFFGPYLNLSVGSDETWDYTGIKLRLSILPAIAIVLGGLLTLRAANRAVGSLGAWLAMAGGVWLVVGGSISLLYNDGRSEAGRALGSTGERVLSQLTWYQGIGALVIALAGFALGRLALRGEGDAALARDRADHDRALDGRDRDVAGRRDRDVVGRDRTVVRDRAVDGDNPEVVRDEPVAGRSEPVQRPVEPATRSQEVAGPGTQPAQRSEPTAVAERPPEPAPRRNGLLGRLRG